MPIVLDAREIEPTAEGFLTALGRAIGHGADVWSALARLDRPVLFIDTSEQIAPIDTWLRETFVPRLPGQAIVVMAGRNPPAPGWRTDPGLIDICRMLPLRNLTPAESREYLTGRRISEARQEELVAVTYGHPLALALFADLATQRDTGDALTLDRHPDVVQALMERFVASVPSRRHRDALGACALARVTTEALLADVLETDEAHELFEWLRGLSFIEQGREGLFPHDLARDVLEADLRWRAFERHRDLHRRVRASMRRRLEATSGSGVQQQGVVYDKLFLHKRSPIMRPYFDFGALDAVHIEPARAADGRDIIDILRRHEGEASAGIAAGWLERQPEAFHVWRSPDGRLQGLMAHLCFAAPDTNDLDADPALPAIWTHVRAAGGLRPGERMLVHRFWAGRDGYQDSASQTMIAASASLLWMTLPGLAWSFPCTANPEHWAPMFAYCNFTREPALDFVVGGRAFGVFAHDWRREPIQTWLDTLAERELAGSDGGVQPGSLPRVLALSRPDFDDAVRQALRDYARPSAFAANPLTRSRLTLGGTEATPAGTLRALLLTAVESLQEHPRDHRLHRALWHTYIQPAASQELAAERLGLPFSTFRYHLKGGIERVSDWLWEREVAN
jgi:hypothetical protein